MNTPEFNALFEQTVQMCRETLCAKADEYAEGEKVERQLGRIAEGI